MLRMFLIYFPSYFCFLVAIFIQVFLPVASISHYEGMVGKNNYREAATCVVSLTESEAVWKPTIAVLMGDNMTENKLAFFDELYQKLNKQNRPFVTVEAISNETLDVSLANYVVITFFNDCEDSKSFDFTNLTEDLKYLILVESHADCSSQLKGFGDGVAKYDVSFLLKYPADTWDLYTYIPDIDHETCGVVIDKPMKINTCKKGKLAQSLVFPSKVTTDYMKCPFKVGIGALYPFAMIENRTSLKTYDSLAVDRVSGMDFELIKIISDRFNATLNLYYIYKQEENPYVDMDYIPLLINGSLEACVGGLYRIYGDVVEYSGVYASQQVTWIYTAQRENKTWENMALTIDGLYLFLVFHLIYSVVWYLICAFDKKMVSFKFTFLYSWGALLGTTSLQDAKTFKQKVINIVYLNMCLHLSVYISIQLYSFFTIQGPPEMLRTNEDVMNSGRTPYLRSLTKYFVNDEKYVRFANTSTECDGFQDCAEVSLLRRGVTLFISGYFYPFQAASAVNDEARMLRSVENLLTVYYEMIIRKESPLVKKFKKTLVRIFEAGITEKLFKEAIGLNVVAKAKIAAQNMMTSSYACQSGCKLNLHQFYGVFYVWGFGCAASICLFVLEILMQKPNQWLYPGSRLANKCFIHSDTMLKYFTFAVICVLFYDTIESAVPIDIVTEQSNDDTPRQPAIELYIPKVRPLISRTGPEQNVTTDNQEAIKQDSKTNTNGNKTLNIDDKTNGQNSKTKDDKKALIKGEFRGQEPKPKETHFHKGEDHACDDTQCLVKPQ